MKEVELAMPLEKRKVRYIESFKKFDNEFVVHESYDDEDEFRVTHKATGFAVPLSKSNHVELSKRLAIAFLDYYGEVKFLDVLKKTEVK